MMQSQARCPLSCGPRCLSARTPAAAAGGARASRLPAVAVCANTQHQGVLATAKVALSTCLTAAALLTISPAIAAAGLAVQDPPSYGPWSFYNMTPYLVELSLEYSPENPLNPSDTCYNSIGGTDPGRYFVYPSPRGQCQVVNIHATALEAPTKPGGNPTIVSTSDWQPIGILSTAFNTWVVMQVQDGTPTGSLKIAEVVDSAQPS